MKTRVQTVCKVRDKATRHDCAKRDINGDAHTRGDECPFLPWLTVGGGGDVCSVVHDGERCG